MSLIIAKNKVNFEQLMGVETPEATDSFTPIPHSELVSLTRSAMENAGLEVLQEEHALARGGQRYFGGFAVRGNEMIAQDRNLVIGLRNSSDKSFAASICLGLSMLVCENLCFSASIKLARRHTTNILHDLPRVLADAVSRATTHWNNMTNRIEAYKNTEAVNVEETVIRLVDSQALPSRDIYNVIQEFRNPRHQEFKGGSLWTLYNSLTECLKGGDLSKLPSRTTIAQSILDTQANFRAVSLIADSDLVLAN